MGDRLRTRTGRLIALIAVLGLTITVLASATGATPPSGPPPQSVKPAGCNASQGVIAHHANGADSHKTGFVSCLTYAFFGFGEANLVVTDNGTVVYGGPILPSGGTSPGFVGDGSIARSTDKGENWNYLQLPPSPISHANGAGDPRVWLDPVTGRIWFSKIGFGLAINDPGLCATELFYSDDGGQTWVDHPNGTSAAPGSPFACPYFDFPHLFTAPRTTSGPAPQGSYPDVVYLCKSTPLGSPPPPPMCWKSLDSGVTWTQVPGMAQHARRGTGGLDGTIYGVVAKQLHYSTDEGATFTVGAGVLPATFSPASDIAVDRDGTVYVVGTMNGLPAVSYTKDKGATWSTPVSVQMPGVNHIHRPTIAVPRTGTPGQVAVAYLGNGDTTDAPGSSGHVGGPHHGYITTTDNIFAADPEFHSVQADTNADPILPHGYNPGGATTTQSRADFIGVYIDEQGNPWAYFYKDCLPSDTCPVTNNHPSLTNWLGAVATVAPKGFAHAAK
jgi:hypothetical protein